VTLGFSVVDAADVVKPYGWRAAGSCYATPYTYTRITVALLYRPPHFAPTLPSGCT